jgi:hypothetical protein
VAISGTAGVGKTSLALWWAHRVAVRFPDAQLYVDLRGYDPVASPLEPAEVLRRFLPILGVPSERLPLDSEALTGLYRSQLTGRRVLLILDNARDAEQVRPLLPASPGCLALVTSRDQLLPLIISNGAEALPVSLLSDGDSVDLLRRRLGHDRVSADPAAVEEIITRCARLPLALAIVAAHAQVRPEMELASLVRHLNGGVSILHRLDGGDLGTDLRAVFAASVRVLSDEAARLFRLSALAAGRELSVAAMASLTARSPAQVGGSLTELVRANLIVDVAPGRYSLHDLLREYARELVRDGETHEDRVAAARRLRDHDLRTAHGADQLPHPGAASLNRAAASARDAVADQLAWSVDAFLDRHGPWSDLLQAHRTAVEAGGQDGAAALDGLRNVTSR